MKTKIPIFNILSLFVSVFIFLNIDAILHWNYQTIFQTYILPKIPHAKFENFFHENRFNFDKNFMDKIWIIAIIINVFLIYFHFKLLKITQVQYPDKKRLFRIFSLKLLLYSILFFLIPYNFIVVGRNSLSSTMISEYDKITYAIFMFVFINMFALIPYLSQKGINTFIKLKDVVIFNVGTFTFFSILLYFKVTPFKSSSISGFFFTLKFAKKIKYAWNQIGIFFDIKGKRINEMF